MIDIENRHLHMINAILQRYIPEIPVWIFGSRIKGTARPYSDVDLVMVGEQPIPQMTYYQMKDALEESDLPYRVDLLDWHRISDEFKSIIQQQYMVFPTH